MVEQEPQQVEEREKVARYINKKLYDYKVRDGVISVAQSLHCNNGQLELKIVEIGTVNESGEVVFDLRCPEHDQSWGTIGRMIYLGERLTEENFVVRYETVSANYIKLLRSFSSKLIKLADETKIREK